jgi:Icc-related predicted phosphoesterase
MKKIDNPKNIVFEAGFIGRRFYYPFRMSFLYFDYYSNIKIKNLSYYAWDYLFNLGKEDLYNLIPDHYDLINKYKNYVISLNSLSFVKSMEYSGIIGNAFIHISESRINNDANSIYYKISNYLLLLIDNKIK